MNTYDYLGVKILLAALWCISTIVTMLFMFNLSSSTWLSISNSLIGVILEIIKLLSLRYGAINLSIQKPALSVSSLSLHVILSLFSGYASYTYISALEAENTKQQSIVDIKMNGVNQTNDAINILLQKAEEDMNENYRTKAAEAISNIDKLSNKNSKNIENLDQRKQALSLEVNDSSWLILKFFIPFMLELISAWCLCILSTRVQSPPEDTPSKIASSELTKNQEKNIPKNSQHVINQVRKSIINGKYGDEITVAAIKRGERIGHTNAKLALEMLTTEDLIFYESGIYKKNLIKQMEVDL